VNDSFSPLTLDVHQLGVTDYASTLELQRAYHREVIAGERGDTLLICSHHPVITLGSSTKPEHLFRSQEELEAAGFQVAKVERGGSVTYHGPEQIILYPILNLSHHKRDVGWYMRSLEEVVIRTLNNYGVTGLRIKGKTGVWTNEGSKIAFSGVRISRWCTFHGISLNVLPVYEHFALINPCGLGAIRVISLAEATSDNVLISEVSSLAVAHFTEVFGYRSRPM
jgi:lipoate-protein ligase B